MLGQHRKWRSVRVLQQLCVVMCKLMVITPPETLFKCDTCEDVDGKLHAICVDGIWAGYQRKTSRPFTNISEKCVPMSASAAASSMMYQRPLHSLLRRDQVGSMLICAIKGTAIHVSTQTLSALVSAIRTVDDGILPPN